MLSAACSGFGQAESKHPYSISDIWVNRGLVTDKIPWLLAWKSSGIYETSPTFVDGFFNRNRNGVVVAFTQVRRKRDGLLSSTCHFGAR